MPASEVFAQAMEHVPALLLTYLTIFVAYWTLGIINIPRWAGRDAVLDRIGQIDPAGINRQSFSALAVISIVSLFMELLLIRWVTSEIRVFAYFKSFVLIACFLGFGLGCYLTHKRIRIAYTLIPLIALAILIEVPWDPMRRLVMQLSAFIAWFSDVHMFGRAYFSGLPLWGFVSAAMAVTIVIPVFGLVALSFVPIGQLVGSYL